MIGFSTHLEYWKIEYWSKKDKTILNLGYFIIQIYYNAHIIDNAKKLRALKCIYESIHNLIFKKNANFEKSIYAILKQDTKRTVCDWYKKNHFLLNVSMFYLFYASEQQIKQANIIFFVSLKWGYMGCDLAQH